MDQENTLKQKQKTIPSEFYCLVCMDLDGKASLEFGLPTLLSICLSIYGIQSRQISAEYKTEQQKVRPQCCVVLQRLPQDTPEGTVSILEDGQTNQNDCPVVVT